MQVSGASGNTAEVAQKNSMTTLNLFRVKKKVETDDVTFMLQNTISFWRRSNDELQLKTFQTIAEQKSFHSLTKTS